MTQVQKKKKAFTIAEKAKRGWWASVVFMLLIVGLIIFLTKVCSVGSADIIVVPYVTDGATTILPSKILSVIVA